MAEVNCGKCGIRLGFQMGPMVVESRHKKRQWLGIPFIVTCEGCGEQWFNPGLREACADALFARLASGSEPALLAQLGGQAMIEAAGRSASCVEGKGRASGVGST